MKQLIYALLGILGLATGATAGEIIKVKSTEVANLFGFEVDNPDTKDKVWNRWTSKNFVVCSIDDNQARYLHDHLEEVRTWILTRWNFPDLDFAAESRLICVDNVDLFEKLFGIKESKVEVRRDNEGKIKMTIIFLLCQDKPSRTIPMPLTEVCLVEMEQRYRLKFGWWFHRGAAILNGPIGEIRQKLANLRSLTVPEVSTLFSMEKKRWNELDPQAKSTFDTYSAAMCLMMRKEYSVTSFNNLLKNTGRGVETQQALQTHFNMNYSQLDTVFRKYVRDLVGAITGQDRNPPADSYFQIVP